MSTPPELPVDPQPEQNIVTFDTPLAPENGGRKVMAESAAELERRIEYLQDKRKEDHFFWVIGASILFDVWMCNQVSQSIPIFSLIFTLQLLLLFGLATRLQIDWAVELLRWMIFKLKPQDKNSDT